MKGLIKTMIFSTFLLSAFLIIFNPTQANAATLKNGDIISLKSSANNKYVCADNNGTSPLIANRSIASTASNSFEAFTVSYVLVNYAKQFLGVPYVWGGTTPAGFDCSGFTQYVYSHFGYAIGRTTYNQIYAGKAVSRENLQPGDLVFTDAGHVGIYVGNNQMIHSPQTGDVVKISTIWSFYAGRRILG